MERVLVADDDDILRATLAEVLTRAGYSVTSVPDGGSLQEALEGGHFAVAVLNLGVPGLGDALLATRLRGRGTGVVALAGSGVERDQASVYDNGADLYFRKPVDGRVLASAIKRLAERVGKRRASR